jgi:hypothetical protein
MANKANSAVGKIILGVIIFYVLAKFLVVAAIGAALVITIRLVSR